jgi:aminoglycoside 6'-N-acetyltransferase I
MWKIEPITLTQTDVIQQMGEILYLALREHWPSSWKSIAEGIEEVHEILEEGFALAAFHPETQQVVGWIGGLPEYDGHVWELHPLAVHPDFQGRGIGTQLVKHFEAEVQQRDVVTIMLGSDDEDNMTSLSHADVYKDLGESIRTIQNYKNHPYSFYQRLGYTIIGVIPDANGLGKPDILMAKRLT